MGSLKNERFQEPPPATADATFDQFHFFQFMDLTGFNGHAHDLVPAISSFGSDHFQFAVMDTDGFHQTLMVHPLELDLRQAPLQTIVRSSCPRHARCDASGCRAFTGCKRVGHYSRNSC